MKIALAQINYHIGNFESNVRKIKSSINSAKEGGAELVVFAELAISGYPARDFLELDDFIEKCYASINEIARECEDIAVIIGGPSRNPNPKGKPLFNSAFFLYNGKIQQVVNKSLLPNYDIFDEYRYFEPNRVFRLVEFKGKRIAVTICEDLWDATVKQLYVVNPMKELAKLKPDFIINIAASPFHYGQAEIRQGILAEKASKYEMPIIYLNHVGAQTELLFDGGSFVMDSKGNIRKELSYFNEDFQIIELNDFINPLHAKPEKKSSAPPPIVRIHDGLVMGIHDYFKKFGFKKATLGLSGGIDSAVTLVLAVKALGSEHVRAILLPSKFSSKHSVDDAIQMANNLNIQYDIISIEDTFETVESTLAPLFKGLAFDLTEENIQARLRAVFLMAYSNKFGYILLNTSNKSEAAVGYGTLYGDMCGGLSVLGDVYKTQVYDLAAYINQDSEIIPKNIINKPPSAELRPGQKDSDSLPEYDILDQILFRYIEKRQGPNELMREGFNQEIINKVLRLVNSSEHKRYQSPPILRVSPKAFGMGRRMPIVGKYLI